MTEAVAWLEDGSGRRWPIAATCALGRATGNDVVVDNGKVSRRHALIHRQDAAEYWVIDLGSGNGTYINGRRIALATRLAKGDTLTLGDATFTFDQNSKPVERRASRSVSSAQTIIDIRAIPCWLLVADIKGSTALAARLPMTDMAVMVGRWMAACKEIIEQKDGVINKYLGDGFLAYWYASRDRMPDLGAALERFRAMQRQRQDPPFRLALHYGVVTVGGGGSVGEDSLSGRDVSLVFRMEKLAGSLGCDVMVSETARDHLGSDIPMSDLGVHPLAGFEAERLRFYALI